MSCRSWSSSYNHWSRHQQLCTYLFHIKLFLHNYLAVRFKCKLIKCIFVAKIALILAGSSGLPLEIEGDDVSSNPGTGSQKEDNPHIYLLLCIWKTEIVNDKKALGRLFQIYLYCDGKWKFFLQFSVLLYKRNARRNRARVGALV